MLLIVNVILSLKLIQPKHTLFGVANQVHTASSFTKQFY